MNTRRLRMLVVDDSPDDALLLEREARRGGFDVVTRRVDTLEGVQAALREPWDVVLCDYSMPELDAPRVLDFLRHNQIEIPCIIVSGTVDEEIAVGVLRSGAQDFITKQNMRRLVPAIERELRENKVKAERTRTEHTLRQTEASVRSLIESLPDGVLVHREGTLVYVNQSAATLLGYVREDLLGKNIGSLLVGGASETSPIVRGADEERKLGEERLLRANGATVDVDVTVTTILFGGEPSILAVLRDATARRDLTARMIEVDRMIAVGTLAAGVGHEINNPLAYVVANIEYVQAEIDGILTSIGADEGGRALAASENVALGGRLTGTRQVLGEALEGGHRIRSIVEDLRMFSREEVQPGPVDVRPILESALRMAAHEVKRAGRVVREFTDVPPVDANPSRLGQVFLNLIVNAAQALRGKADLDNAIILRTFEEDGRVVVEVADTGPGILPSDLNRVFAPFFTTKGSREGTGLGLAICRTILGSIGGEVTVQSPPGKGACFRVSLKPSLVT